MQGYPPSRRSSALVFFPSIDNLVPGVPAEDRLGRPHDFSPSARLEGSLARNVDLVGQGRFDAALRAAHLGILNSPKVWQIALRYSTAPKV